MSFEITVHSCLQCGHIIPKRVWESRNRTGKRRYCSTDCSKKYMAKEKVGWFSNLNTINQRLGNEKKKVDPIDDIAPVIWSDEEFKEFNKGYGALLSELESE